MKPLKIAGAAIAAIIVVAGLVLVVGIPSSFLTSAIQARVERETGYRLTIAGSTKIGLWPSLNVTLDDVTLQDPKDRDSSDQLTVGSIEANIKLASLWSGAPEVTELVIDRPVLTVPLLRERTVPRNSPPRGVVTSTEAEAKQNTVRIGRVTVTDGAIVFSNLRDRVTNRIDGINAKATIGDDRNIRATGSARASEHPLKFVIKVTPPAPPLERQTIPVDLMVEAPDLLKNPLSAKAEIRLNGTVVMINGLTGALGDAAFNGWASVDIASKPLVKLDLDFQRFDVAMSKGNAGSTPQPWSNVPIDLGGLNYVDLQAKISAAEINIGDSHIAPVAIDATLASGVLKCRLANLGAYGGQANADLIVDASPAVPAYALRSDLAGVRALPLLQSVADFDRLDGKLQAKLSLQSSGASQRAIMSNLDGTVFTVFQDGAIRGINVAQMIRSLTSGTLSGWQQSNEQTTDLSQLSASFRIEKGKATSTDLNLVGPLVRVTGSGTIDLGEKTLALRTEPKLVMTTQGQGRTSDPVGLGIPVVIDGPWASPRIYPDMAGILDNPDAAYAKLKDMGKGLFGPNGALGGLGGNLLGGNAAGGTAKVDNQTGNATGSNPLSGLLGQSGTGGTGGASEPLGGDLGKTIGNLIQQGIGQGGTQGNVQGRVPGQSRALSVPGTPAAAAPSTSPAPTPAQSDPTAQPAQESQPMNDVLRQLFNR
ncbi:AsmA family protein [Bradyrhizobium sp. S69]|uniref:AsmA family protein n=1 Tax=Bradyrhizobium sp. S69 TaxID=1641856 RepID=UPI00131D7A59|nr:AsmA family protein [Bradyrhizobium sp. S69]